MRNGVWLAKPMIIALAVLLFGCTECHNDACIYTPENTAVWSDNNQHLVFTITDYGMNTSKSDNSNGIFTTDLEGNQVEKVWSAEAGQSVAYYSDNYQYMILETHESGFYWGVREYTFLDLTNLNSSVMATNDQPCLEQKIIPSLDGAMLAIVNFSGEENGYITDNDSVSVSAKVVTHYGNGDMYIGCKSLSMNIQLVNAHTRTIIAQFVNENMDMKYYIYPLNQMTVNLEAYWSSNGFIFNNNYFGDGQYFLLRPSGEYESYSLPEGCHPLKTSSGLVSQQNIEAKGTIVLDDGKYGELTGLEFTDLKIVADRMEYEYPSLGKEICVL